MDVLAKRIKDLREKHKMSQAELGKVIGLGNTTICNYESGYSTPDTETLMLIAEALDVSTDYLLGTRTITSPELSGLGVEYAKIARDLQDDGIAIEKIKKAVEFIKQLEAQDKK